MIAYFINPKEDHGCGLYLLRTFLKSMNVLEVSLLVDEKCVVTREDDYIDLLVTRDCVGGKYAVIIENKVNWAIDQNQQLESYFKKVSDRGFERNEIFICYLPLNARNPSSRSSGSVLDRIWCKSFKEQVCNWINGVLEDNSNWPPNMKLGMDTNLRQYLNLILWRLHVEKETEMKTKIFDALQKAESEEKLPTLEDVAALRESVNMLEQCLRRIHTTRMFASVRQMISQKYGLQADVGFCGQWVNPNFENNLTSEEYFYGFTIDDLVVVAMGEDGVGIYVGYAKPQHQNNTHEDFRSFLTKKGAELGDKSNSNWFGYSYLPKTDPTRRDHIQAFVDRVYKMHSDMTKFVKEYADNPK